MKLGYQSDVGAVRSMALKHARDAFRDQGCIDRQWRDLGYLSRPDMAKALAEYDAFAMVLQEFGIEVHFVPPESGTGLDSIYVRDASVVCDRGIILCHMGKAQRSGEPAAVGEALRALDVPIHGAITGDGRLEGGDVAWLDGETLAVGRGYRTNDEGIRQLRELLGDCIRELVVVPLPHWRGPADVFHLMSVLSPLDRDLALVYSRLLPVPFRESLLERGIGLVEVPDAEFESMGCNVLAVGPRRCIMLEGNRETRARLEGAGVEVRTYVGREISAKGCGGPTCLTRPLQRVVAD
jgi:N-dimethylarginine dimethylaminohydrolase